MAGDPKTFRLQFGQWAGQAEAALDALARGACFRIAERVIDATPVDTGFLRGSWQPSIGAPETTEGTEDPGGAAAAAKLSALFPQITAGVRFFMMNNAAYAKRLEFGFVGTDSLGRSYDQKGRFFVTDTVAAWPAVVREVAAELGLKPQ